MRKKIISKDAIIDVATEIIREKDLKSCSMRNISKKLGVAVGTLYNYYPSHDILLDDIFNKSWANTIQRLNDQVFKETNPKNQLLTYVEILNQDIIDRKGIGNAVLGKHPMLSMRFSESSISINLTEILSKIVQGSDKNAHLDSSSTKMLTEWMLIIITTQITKKELNYKTFINELTNRFI